MTETLTMNGQGPGLRARPPVLLGRTGLRQWGGYIHEEWLTQLQGWRGFAAYREMAQNDPIIGASLLAIGLLVRQVTWTVMPASTDPAAQQYADWVKEALFTDLAGGWDALLQEILSMNWAGWAYHEVVYKRRQGWTADPWTRSRYRDGQWGWHSLPIRAQETLDHWEIDNETNQLRGMVQRDPVTGGLYTIPMAKAALFRPQAHKGNPEGRALTLDTPVPTPDGWTTMEALQVGEKLYDEQGRIRYVTAKSEVWHNRPVYEIEFAGGHTIIADANHE